MNPLQMGFRTWQDLRLELGKTGNQSLFNVKCPRARKEQGSWGAEAEGGLKGGVSLLKPDIMVLQNSTDL